MFYQKQKSNFLLIFLFEHEVALAFDDSEMGLLNLPIEPPIIIHTACTSRSLATTEHLITQSDTRGSNWYCQRKIAESSFHKGPIDLNIS